MRFHGSVPGTRWCWPLLVVVLATSGAAGFEVRSETARLPTFSHPFSFDVGPGGRVHVVEDREGRVVSAVPGGGAKEMAGLTGPRLIGVDEAGALLVLVRHGGRWGLVVRRSGEAARSVLLEGGPPIDPVGVAARNGIVWVVDRAPARVWLYAYDGAGLGRADLAGEAKRPFSVALGPSGEAFVTDPAGPGVLALSPAGKLLGPLDLDGSGVTRPTGVAVDGAGRVWVSDGVTGCLAAFAPDGERVRAGCDGRELRLEDPLRLRWREGALWVLEASPGRVRRVTLEEP